MLRLLFAFFFALLVQSRATVIVYAGTSKTTLATTASQFGKQTRFFFIYDTATQDLNVVAYFTLDGEKKYQPFFPIPKTRYISIAQPNSKKAGIFSAVRDVGLSGQEFGYEAFYVRGIEKSVLVSNLSGDTFSNFPKTLSGNYRFTGFVANNPNAVEFNLTLAFDAVRTQTANNGFKTGIQTRDDITAQLIQKGYQ